MGIIQFTDWGYGILTGLIGHQGDGFGFSGLEDDGLSFRTCQNAC